VTAGHVAGPHQAGQQFAAVEGLGDVIVGAIVQAAILSFSRSRTLSTMTGTRHHSRNRLSTVTPSSRQPEVEQDHVRTALRGLDDAVLFRCASNTR